MHRILAIDDDQMMQQILKATLQPEGFEILVSSDGKAGLEAAAARKPDLIILDVNLPDMTGMEVCRALKSAQATKHIPVIMLTGEAREVVNRVEGLNLGAEDYMFKPVSPRLLVSRIKSLLKLTSRPAQH